MSEAATTAALVELHDRIVSCTRCTRLRAYCARVGREKRRAYRAETYWARPVPGFGDPAARILIVGLAPAAHGANRTGRLFTGDGPGGAGDFLMAALHRAGLANRPVSIARDDGLQLRDVYIAAAVRCAPPGNKPTPDEIRNCLPHLAAEAALLSRVQAVVALGRIGFDAYWRIVRGGAGGDSMARRRLSVGRRPVFGHNRSYRLSNGQTLIGSYHPSRQNTHTGRLTPRMLDAVVARAKRVVGD